MFFPFRNLGRAFRLIITGREASVTLKWYREKNVKKLCQKLYKYSDLLLLFNTPQSLLWGFLLPPLWKRGARGDFKLIKFT
jgi:hypothetical protein